MVSLLDPLRICADTNIVRALLTSAVPVNAESPVGPKTPRLCGPRHKNPIAQLCRATANSASAGPHWTECLYHTSHYSPAYAPTGAPEHRISRIVLPIFGYSTSGSTARASK